MIGQVVTKDKDGNPVDGEGKSLTQSTYQPPDQVKKLFAQVQTDYYTAYTLQHRSFDEFDGISLLDRTRLDQETFAAFVGAQWVPQHKVWRWRGRKNTARNRLIGILAHMLAAMLFPYVRAVNDQDDEEKMTARVMQILVENSLRKAGYEIKFLYIVISALVNPAVHVGLEYVEAIQKVKQQLAGGKVKITETIDEFISGMQIHIIPIDEIMPLDFYTFEVQRQPAYIRVRRISYDEARKIYAGKYTDADGKDRFDYVKAGMTRIVLTGQENQTLFDINWTEADVNYVQEITAYYRAEDLQVTFVGGVFFGNEDDVYNTNPFEHRRMAKSGDDWISVPVYPFAKGGFEPLDPTGRFYYYKSAAFKEYWDDKSLNTAYQLLQDGMYLDVIKPIFVSGVSKVDSTVMVPGATVGIPAGAQVTPYSIGPNLAMAMNVLKQNTNDVNESTQDQTQGGIAQPNVTASATAVAQQNAKVFLGVFGLMMANFIEQIGGLAMDITIMHDTLGELDAEVSGDVGLKFKAILAKGKDKGKNVTHKVIFTDKHMGKEYTDKQLAKLEWALFDKAGGLESNTRIYEVNPYQFARMTYSMEVDADQIVSKSMGTDRQQNLLAFQMLTDPRVAPYTDPEAVVDDFIIDEFSNGDPDRYKRKGNSDMLNNVMGQPGGQGGPPASGAFPPQVGSAALSQLPLGT